MCGILGLIRLDASALAPTAPLRRATDSVRHRGPDDEGYALWSPGEAPVVFAGADTTDASRSLHRIASLPDIAQWQVGFGHRRLSIVDLSPAGHQPMVHPATGVTVVYNGEIYNHVELRGELEALGHRFVSHSDTEVLVAAWLQWGAECTERFNGMFAFLVLDPRGGGTVHAVRDRFGVKPLYWARVGEFIAFASEIKQIRSLDASSLRLDPSTVRDYLVNGVVDLGDRTFDSEVRQVEPGCRAVVQLSGTRRRVVTTRWYTLRSGAFRGTLQDAAREYRALLTDSVRLRLRADVPIGSCLSGGLDSSAIVCLARSELDRHGSHAGQITVTARYSSAEHDEWQFAEMVVRRAGAHPVQVWPTLERLREELDRVLWHMDEPFGSTSMFSQWCVFSGAAEAGLKVMLDGQGSDEQLAGYGGSDAALYAGLMSRARIARLWREVLAFRRRHGGLPTAQLILALRNLVPAVDHLLPGRVRSRAAPPAWLRLDAPSRLPEHARHLGDQLRHQLLATSLPALLRYEDRNSMAWSIESRVPFLDYRLVELTFALPDEMKLDSGRTKVVLREALHGILPEPVRDRRDKMGFVTPEALWLRGPAADWFREGTDQALEAAPAVFEPDRLRREVDAVIAGSAPFSFLPWRVLCLGRWLATVERASAPSATAHPMTTEPGAVRV
jgi:asparagine synthase (glutamine-hydrolysing)